MMGIPERPRLGILCDRARLLRRGNGAPAGFRLQCADEPVSERMLGLDIARSLGVIAQSRPQLGNGAGQYPRRDVPVAPDGIQQFVAGNQRAGVTQQDQQHRERFRFQGYRAVGPDQRMRAGVHRNVAKAVALAGESLASQGAGRLHHENLMRPSSTALNAERRRGQPS